MTVRRRPQAAACRQRDGDARGRPDRRLGGGSGAGWETALEARQGNPGPGTRPAPGPRRGTRDRQAEQSGDTERPPAAVGASAPAEDVARGNAAYLGQDVPAGRSPPRPLAPDPVGPAPRQPPSLRGRADQANADKRHRVRDRDRCLHVERLRDGWDDRNPDAASGGDGGTWHRSAATLPTPVEALVERLQQPRDRAQRLRRHAMPPGNGQERP